MLSPPASLALYGYCNLVLKQVRSSGTDPGSGLAGALGLPAESIGHVPKCCNLRIET